MLRLFRGLAAVQPELALWPTLHPPLSQNVHLPRAAWRFYGPPTGLPTFGEFTKVLLLLILGDELWIHLLEDVFEVQVAHDGDGGGLALELGGKHLEDHLEEALLFDVELLVDALDGPVPLRPLPRADPAPERLELPAHLPVAAASHTETYTARMYLATREFSCFQAASRSLMRRNTSCWSALCRSNYLSKRCIPAYVVRELLEVGVNG